MARTGVRTARNVAKVARRSLPRKPSSSRYRNEEVWRLRIYEGLKIVEIAERIGVGRRTVDRILAKMRRKYCLENEKDLRRTVGESLVEKKYIQQKMREIMERKPILDDEGKIVDDAHIRIEAARVYTQVSNYEDQMFGIRDVQLWKELDRLHAKGEHIQSTVQRREAPRRT